MVNTFYDTKQILPKLWLARIQKYWDKKIPTGYPESSTEFNFVTAPEDVAKVKDMESKLGTEESIIKPKDIPTNEAVGNYLGTYDCTGEAGVKTLLSPAKVDANATGVLVFHCKEENENTVWVKVEDTEIINGYVWGTVDSFSPIAVFTLRKDTYLDTSKEHFAADAFVCNGIKTKVYKDAEDKIIAEDAYGKKTELTESTFVVGGSLDGSDVESTDLYIENVKLGKVIGGSWYTKDNDNHKNHTNSVRVVLKNVETTSAVTGSGVWNCVDNVYISAEGCKGTGLGCEESYYKQKSSNKSLEDSELRLLANQWVKNSEIYIKDCNYTILYCGGNNGHSYTANAKLFVDGGEYEYLCNGESNGTVDNCYAEISNAKIGHLNSLNRGHYGNGKTILKNTEVVEGYVFADPKESDPSMADISGKVSLDFDKNCVISDFCVGAISNVEVTDAATAAEHIGSFKISRDTAIIYSRNADVILKDIIVVK